MLETSTDEPQLPSTLAKTARPPLAIVMRVIVPVALLVAGGVAMWTLAKPIEKAKAPPTESKPIRTSVETLEYHDYVVKVKTNGIVQAHNEVALSAQVAGQITKISPSFEVGAYFSKGDVLVEIDSQDYETAVALAEAQKLGAESSLELAVETYERNKNLYEKNGVSEAVLKQSFAAQAQAKAQLAANESQLERAQRDLERTKVRALFDGRVRQRTVGVGQQVGAGAPMGMVFAVDYAEVRLPIASREREYLTLPEHNDDVPVNVELRDAINPESPTVWNAQILRTEGALDADSLELFAIARIDDPFGRKSGMPPLRVGQPVLASIAGKTLEDVVAIPRGAVRQLDQVFLVDKDELTLANKTLAPIWSDEDFLICRDPDIENGHLLAMTRIVYAPDGAKIEIVAPVTAESADGEPSDPNTITKTVAKPAKAAAK